MKKNKLFILVMLLPAVGFLLSGCFGGKKYKKVSVPVYRFGDETEQVGSNWKTEEKVYVEGVQEYRVQPGDTLSKIGRMFNVSTTELSSYNGISDPDRITVGMRLQIPPVSMQESSTPHLSKDENRITHQVESGETLWQIADIYGVDVEILKETNHLESTQISTGQILYIPLQ